MAVTIVSSTNNNSEKKTGALVVRQITSPAKDSCAGPYLFTDKNGIVYLSWVEKRGEDNTLKFSTLVNDQWSEPQVIASGNKWFVNWADYPVIVSDGNNNLVAHYLEKSAASTYAYDVKFITSPDKDKSWSNSKILNDDGKQAEHGFVSMRPFGDKFFISWLDGRNTATEKNEGHEGPKGHERDKNHESGEGHKGHKGHEGQMTIGGAILTKDGIKENEWELDNRVCDCCQTSVAITNNGPVVIYRDRSDDEIRDMSIVRYVNGQWAKSQTIFPDNWKIEGCPVNGPMADAIGNNLAIVWFSMSDKKGQVKIVFSEDGGATVNKPVRIDEAHTIGRVDVMMLDDKTAMVCWMEGAEIKAVKVHADGRKGPSIIIASSSESRSSGFPQMTKSDDKLFFAWTDNKEKTIKAAVLALLQ